MFYLDCNRSQLEIAWTVFHDSLDFSIKLSMILFCINVFNFNVIIELI